VVLHQEPKHCWYSEVMEKSISCMENRR